MASSPHALARLALASALLAPLGPAGLAGFVGEAEAAGSIASPAAGLVLDGPEGRVALDDYRGRYVYVDFFASWCAPCRASFPFMDALLERHAGEGLSVVAIGLDADPADAREFAARLAPGFDIAFDPAAASAEAFGLKGMPSSYLLDPEGRVVWSHVGFRQKDAAAIDAAVARSLRTLEFADAEGRDR